MWIRQEQVGSGRRGNQRDEERDLSKHEPINNQ